MERCSRLRQVDPHRHRCLKSHQKQNKSINEHRSSSKSKCKDAIKQLQRENNQLKNQNYVFQEYFVTFEEKLKDTRKENLRLREQIKELKSKERQVGSIEKKKSNNSLYMTQATNRYSRAQQNYGMFGRQYL